VNQLEMFGVQCVVCGRDGTVTTKALNGLPLGVAACEGCREAVVLRQVGVSLRNGKVHVTDGRVPPVSAVREMKA